MVGDGVGEAAHITAPTNQLVPRDQWEALGVRLLLMLSLCMCLA